MLNNVSISAIVLAGGQSSRMGQDKALILIDGVPLLQRICNIAQQCTNQVYVVTPWPERYQNIFKVSLTEEQVTAAIKLIREDYLTIETKTQGPLIGFAQALKVVQTDWVLLLACDLPKLQFEVLQNWVSQLKNVPESAIAFLPRHHKGWEPLCGFYRRSCLQLLNEYINQGGRAFQYWLAQHPVQELLLNDRQVLFNCNTPQDLELILDKEY